MCVCVCVMYYFPNHWLAAGETELNNTVHTHTETEEEVEVKTAIEHVGGVWAGGGIEEAERWGKQKSANKMGEIRKDSQEFRKSFLIVWVQRKKHRIHCHQQKLIKIFLKNGYFWN